MTTTHPVALRIEAEYASMTKSFKKIATYIMANLDGLPYETAETIARNVGVSGVSVGRFLRFLGYRNIDELKSELRVQAVAAPWRVTDRYQAHLTRDKHAAAYLEQELQLIRHVYALAETPVFHTMLDKLAAADAVFVVGVQTMSGLMRYFADLLAYMRPNVYFVTEHSGFFIEVFNHSHQKPYMLLCDIRRYAAVTRQLCREAQAQQLDFGLITDEYCDWAREYCRDILPLKTASGQFWDSTTPIVSLCNLMLTRLAENMGDSLEQRLAENRLHQSRFGQFEE